MSNNTHTINTNSTKNSSLMKIIIPIVMIITTIALVMLIFNNPPENKRGKPSQAAQMTVVTQTIAPQVYQVIVESFGTVQPQTKSILFAQVSGQINKVSQEFRDGGFFEKGDVLIQLDDRDHRAEVNIALASFMSAKQKLQEEDARVQQAEADWQRLGNGKVASALVLRKPQLEAAKADVLSAQAQLDKAKLSLERTKIIAPYAGRILKKNVDIGQVVSSNTQLADIYAVDYVEIRLPIKNKDLPLMRLPEEYRNAKLQSSKILPSNGNVVISSNLLGEQTWQGKVVRTESAIDEMSQQLYVIAQIFNPYDINRKKDNQNSNAQIKIGQYVTAEITGRTLTDALVIPSSAIYQGSYVYIVEDGLLMRKEVLLGWQNGTESIVKSGLVSGDVLVLTALGQVSSGTPVAIQGDETISTTNKKQRKQKRDSNNRKQTSDKQGPTKVSNS